MASTAPPGSKLRILMLHGYTQSGHLFEIKTKALKKALEKHFPPAPKPGHLRQYPGGVELLYPTAPIRLDAADIPGASTAEDATSDPTDTYGWWKRRGEREPYTYDGLERGLAHIAGVLAAATEPVDGVVGFSQGGAAAGMLASLLEAGRRAAFERAQTSGDGGAGGGIPFPAALTRDSGAGREDGVLHAPLRFAVSYSGFGAGAQHPLYRAFYEPQIQTPMLHFVGTLDTVVTEERSLRLVDACVDGRGREGGVPRLVYHPGGHFLPSSQKQCVAALVAFIREVLGEEASGAQEAANGKKEEKAEDMDLPF